MRAGLYAALAGVTLGWSGIAAAATVINPIPQPIPPGLSVSIVPFAIAPATSPTVTRANVQGMRSPADGSGRLFVNDTRGVISVTGHSGGAATPWFDIRSQGVGFAETNSQTGLLSFAFHPNFGRNPGLPGYNTFYTIDTTLATGVRSPDYAGNGPVDHHDVVREWTVADPSATTATVTGTRELLRVAQPLGDHGPGTIAFNPTAAPGTADYGKLYIGLGDGGGVNDPYNNAQDLSSPFGKILRIDPADPDGAGPLRYAIPGDNPFAGQSGTLGEVWASGLRNPQQFSWDKQTGTMYIGDIGQAQLEEVNVGRAGADYGWPMREGTFGKSPDKGDTFVTDDPNMGFANPIGQYDHDEGSAIGGIQLYRGSLIPELFGRAITTDIVNGRLFYFDPLDTSGVGGTAMLSELMLLFNGAPTSMLALEGARGRVDLRLGVDDLGEIYLLTKQDGDIYRLAAASVPEPATWAMLLLGVALTGAWMRRSRPAPARDREMARQLAGLHRRRAIAGGRRPIAS